MWPCKPCGNAHFLTCQKLQSQLDLASLLQENRRVEQFSFRKRCGGGPTSNGFPHSPTLHPGRRKGTMRTNFSERVFHTLIVPSHLPPLAEADRLGGTEDSVQTQFRLPTSYPFSAIGHSRKSDRELGFESSQSRNEECLCCIRAPLSPTAPSPLANQSPGLKIEGRRGKSLRILEHSYCKIH